MSTEENNPIRRGLIWNSISNIGKYGLMFVGTMILARLLSPEDYGLIGIISVFIAIAEVLISAGLGGAVIKKQDAKDIDFSTLTTYNLGVSLCIYVVFYFLAPWIAGFYSKPIIEPLIRIYSFVILIHAFAIAPQVSLTKQLRFKALSIINLVSGILGLACAIVMANYGYGVYSLIGQYIIQSLAVSILLFVVSKYKIRIAFSKASFKEQFSFGMNTTLATILKSLSENLIGNVIAKCSSIVQTGYYTQSNRLCHIPQSFFFNLIDHTFFPVLSQINDKNHFIMRITKLNERTNLILIFLFGGAITCCKELVYVLLGEKWMEAEWNLSILLYAGTFICLSNVGRNVLKCMGYTKQILIVEIYMFILTMISLLIGFLIKDYKVILYSYLISCIIKTIYIDFVVGKYIELQLKYQIISMLKMMIPVAILIISIGNLNISPVFILNGLLKGTLYFCFSALCIWIMKAIRIINI